MRTTPAGIVAAIRDALDHQGLNPHSAALAAGLPANAVRYVLDGKEPRLSRLIDVCAAVGLDVYVVRPGVLQSTGGRDLRLSLVVDSLESRWDHLGEREREWLATAIEATTELAAQTIQVRTEV